MSDGTVSTSSPNQATMSDPVITRQRLESCINDSLQTAGVLQDVSFELIAEKAGFLSNITKAKLTWTAHDKDREVLPKSVILKKPTLDKVKGIDWMEKIMSAEGLRALHNRECDAYQFFNQNEPAPMPMAKCFLKEKITDKPGSGLIILEDLSDQGRSLTFRETMSVDKVMVLVEYFAAIHAYGLAHPEYRDCMSRIPLKFTDTMFNDVMPCLPLWRERFPDRFKFTDEQIAGVMDDSRLHMDKLLNPEEHGGVGVLCLGDIQPNNVLWKVTEDGSLSDEVLAFLDFQLTFNGACCYDLLQLTRLPAGVWEQNRDRVFNHYLTSVKAKSTQPVPISIDDLCSLEKSWDKAWHVAALTAIRSFDALGERKGLSEEARNSQIDIMFEKLNSLGI